ncbi:MAG: hypothetical protein JKY51_00770 [Opitutaceae bacterium]|nr:hypothetical protein [Opitutaceae bacterium]
MNFPEWAPSELCAYLEELVVNFGDQKHPKEVSVSSLPAIDELVNIDMFALKKLLTEERMSSVWNGLAELEISNVNQWFFQSVCYALKGATEGIQLPIKERQKYLKETKIKAKDMRLHLVSLDKGIEKLKVYPKSNDGSVSLEDRYKYSRSIEELLEDIVRTIENKLPNYTLLKSPNKKGSHVVYFIRFLAIQFHREVDDPMVNLVAPTAKSLFDKKIITPSYVSKLISG